MLLAPETLNPELEARNKLNECGVRKFADKVFAPFRHAGKNRIQKSLKILDSGSRYPGL
jgi:hypothetical protein